MRIQQLLLSSVLGLVIGTPSFPGAAEEACSPDFGGPTLTYAGNARIAAPFLDAALALGNERGPANVLVVLDIDNTLLAGLDDLGSDQWYRWQKMLLDRPGPDPGEVAPDLDGMLAVRRFLFAARPMRATEPDMPDVVRVLQDRGFPVLALTARDPRTIGATFRELTRNRFDPTRTAPAAPGALAEAAIPLDPARPEAVGLTPREIVRFGLQVPLPVMYRDGVYLVAGQHKGAMLRVLLNRLGVSYSAIAYLDDRENHVCEMADAYAGQPETLSAWRYDHERARALGFLDDRERQQRATRDWGLMTAGLPLLCDAVPEHCRWPIADAGGAVEPDPETAPMAPITLPDRPLRLTTWNLEHMMSEAVFNDWVAACAPHGWDDDTARDAGKQATLTYCNAHSGLDWPCEERREALALRTPEAFERKVAALQSRAAELDADIYAFQEVSDAAAVGRILAPETYEIFVAPTEIAMNVAFAVRRDLAAGVDVRAVDSLSVCVLEDRMDPMDPTSCIPGRYRTRPGLELTLRAAERTVSLLNVHLKSSCRGHLVSDPPLKRLKATTCRSPDFDQDTADADYRESVANGCALLRDQVPAIEHWVEGQARAGRDFMVLGDFNRDVLRELRDGMPARLDGTAAQDPILPGTAIGSILKEISDNEPDGTDLHLVRADVEARDRTCHSEDGATYSVSACHQGIDHFLIGKGWVEAVSDDPRSLRATGRDYGDSGYCAENARPSDHCPLTLEIALAPAAGAPEPRLPLKPPPVEVSPRDGLSGLPPPPGELSGEPLRAWLREHWYTGHHRTLGYETARRAMYSSIDVAADGRVYGVYRGFGQPARSTTFLDPSRAEHTVPQSYFGRSDPMVSDLHHLFPTHKAVSSARGSDPFGEIPDRAVAPSYGITADGAFADSSGVPGDDPNAYSEDRHEVFEPRGAHDGDAARAVFYFYTMYPGRAGAIERIVHGDPRVLGDRHRLDPPDAWERQRNDRIEAVQGNRNPYIDDPDLVCRAWGIGCP